MTRKLSNHERCKIERVRRIHSNEDWAMAKEEAFMFIVKSKLRRWARVEALEAIGFSCKGIFRRPPKRNMFIVEVYNPDTGKFDRSDSYFSLDRAEVAALELAKAKPLADIRVIETVGVRWRNF